MQPSHQNYSSAPSANYFPGNHLAGFTTQHSVSSSFATPSQLSQQPLQGVPHAGFMPGLDHTTMPLFTPMPQQLQQHLAHPPPSSLHQHQPPTMLLDSSGLLSQQSTMMAFAGNPNAMSFLVQLPNQVPMNPSPSPPSSTANATHWTMAAASAQQTVQQTAVGGTLFSWIPSASTTNSSGQHGTVSMSQVQQATPPPPHASSSIGSMNMSLSFNPLTMMTMVPNGSGSSGVAQQQQPQPLPVASHHHTTPPSTGPYHFGAALTSLSMMDASSPLVAFIPSGPLMQPGQGSASPSTRGGSSSGESSAVGANSSCATMYLSAPSLSMGLTGSAQRHGAPSAVAHHTSVATNHSGIGNQFPTFAASAFLGGSMSASAHPFSSTCGPSSIQQAKHLPQAHHPCGATAISFTSIPPHTGILQPLSALSSGEKHDATSNTTGGICRHFLEGKCNRRKCRFPHEAPPSIPKPPAVYAASVHHCHQDPEGDSGTAPPTRRVTLSGTESSLLSAPMFSEQDIFADGGDSVCNPIPLAPVGMLTGGLCHAAASQDFISSAAAASSAVGDGEASTSISLASNVVVTNDAVFLGSPLVVKGSASGQATHQIGNGDALEFV